MTASNCLPELPLRREMSTNKLSKPLYVTKSATSIIASKGLGPGPPVPDINSVPSKVCSPEPPQTVRYRQRYSVGHDGDRAGPGTTDGVKLVR